MRVTAIDIYAVATGYTPKLATFAMSSIDPTQKYIVKSASGLDADEIVSRFNGSTTGTVGKFYILKPKSRTVTFSVKLNPQRSLNESASDLRDELYKTIYSSSYGKIELQFMNENAYVASLRGFVSKFEANLFTSNPEVVLTVYCEDAYLRSNFYTTHLNVNPYDARWVDSNSNAPHGFRASFKFLEAVPLGLTISGNNGGYEPFTIEYPFLANDRLEFSSEDNNRYLYVSRGPLHAPTITHLADKLTVDSVWPYMFPGETYIVFSTAAIIIPSVSYQAAYWGV